MFFFRYRLKNNVKRHRGVVVRKEDRPFRLQQHAVPCSVELAQLRVTFGAVPAEVVFFTAGTELLGWGCWLAQRLGQVHDRLLVC